MPHLNLKGDIMVSKTQFINGVIDYIDNEMMPHLPTSGKWSMGAMVILAKNRSENMLDSLVANPLFETLGVVKDEKIDIDLLTDALKESASKYGKLTLNIPTVGVLSFTSSDVDSIKSFIKNGGE